MLTHWIAISALALMFIIATALPINMGVLGFAGAFLVGTLAGGLTPKEILGGFPADLFLTLAGITWIFALAQINGTIDWLVRGAVRAVGGRIAAIPWIMFATAALLTSVGAVSPAAVAILAPIALGFALQYGISPLMMGLMIIHGAQGGGFSPISIYGGITNRVVAKAGLPISEWTTMFASLGVNLAVAALLFVVLGGLRLRRMDAQSQVPDGAPAATAAEPIQLLTAGALLLLAVLTLGFGFDIGFLAISLGLLLSLVQPERQRRALAQLPWPEIMLILGVSTYVGVMGRLGTITWAGNSVAELTSPLIAALLLCFVGAIVSAFASSTAVLGSLIPLGVPFLQGDNAHMAIGFIAAMAVSSTIVDVSPFSTNGALVLASARDVDRDRFFRRLLGYGALVTVVAPVVVWGLFVAL